jgi:uncharacterized protein involved in exopolysaccharide biosynthesis
MAQENLPLQEDEGSFDVTWIIDRLSFVWLAIRRHLGIVTGSIVLLSALGVLAAKVMPNRYYVEVKLLAPRPDLIASLTNPGRTLGSDSRAGSRAVLELMRRDNLLAAIHDTDLLTQWRATRPPILRLKDWVAFAHEPSDAELTDMLVETLKKRFTAYTQQQDDGSGALTVGLTWSDPVMTVRLLNAVIKGFLEFRQNSELAVLGESIGILEERLTEARRDLEVALAGAKAAAPRRVTRAEITPTPEPAATAVDTRALADLAQVRSALAVKRRALDELVSYRQRRIEELQTQLTEQRAVYSENHPIVANTRRSLEAVAADSPQITALRREVADLEARYAEKGGGVADVLGAGGDSTARSSAGGSTVVVDPGRLRPAEDFERSRLTAAIARYYGVSDRLEGAKLERDSAQAAARYRFVVVQPPLPPRSASNALVKTALTVGGIGAGFLLGLVGAIAAEHRRGRIVQEWQVERGLGLPILAVLPRMARPGSQEWKA